MGMQVSLRQLESLETRAKSAASRIKRIQEEAHDVMMAVVGTVETMTTSFGFGVINGRWGGPEFVGVPVDLLSGIVLHGLAFAIDTGSEHLHNLANGALACYFATLGTGVGQKMATEAQQAAAALAANAAAPK